MMNYEEFKNTVEKEFKNYLNQEYQDMEVHIAKTEKVNMTLDSIHMIAAAEKNEPTISPIMYINDMYSDYIENGDIDKTLTDAAQQMCMCYENMPDMSFDFNNLDDKILFRIINKEQNKEMLKDMPYRDFQDLAVTYYMAVNINDDAQGGIIKINNAIAEMLGKNEEQLYELAYKNTRDTLTPTVHSMKEIIYEMLLNSGVPEEIINGTSDMSVSDDNMFVISNNVKSNGAISMIYEDILQELSEKVNDNLYIMPSSIHEVIAVPAGDFTADELSKMVREVNMKEVDISDRLSNEVYSYDKDKRELTLATDNPDKRLEYDMERRNEARREWNGRTI